MRCLWPPALAVVPDTWPQSPVRSHLHPLNTHSAPPGSRRPTSPTGTARGVAPAFSPSQDPAAPAAPLGGDYLLTFPRRLASRVAASLGGCFADSKLHFCCFLLPFTPSKSLCEEGHPGCLQTFCGHLGMHCPTETLSANGGSIPRRPPKPFRTRGDQGSFLPPWG